MPKARMLVGGIVEPGAGQPGAVIAYVAVSLGALGSRLFKVDGSASAPEVTELDAATTVDLSQFDREAQNQLNPAVRAILATGGQASIARPSPEWVCAQVRRRLQATEGLVVD